MKNLLGTIFSRGAKLDGNYQRGEMNHGWIGDESSGFFEGEVFLRSNQLNEECPNARDEWDQTYRPVKEETELQLAGGAKERK